MICCFLRPRNILQQGYVTFYGLAYRHVLLSIMNNSALNIHICLWMEVSIFLAYIFRMKWMAVFHGKCLIFQGTVSFHLFPGGLSVSNSLSTLALCLCRCGLTAHWGASLHIPSANYYTEHWAFPQVFNLFTNSLERSTFGSFAQILSIANC